MRIERVSIQNWRSIKDVEFCPADISVLVGANNAGKTNILSAINFLLGEKWPMPANLSDTDFFQASRRFPIRIQLSFSSAAISRLDFDSHRSPYALQAFDVNDTPIRGFSNADREKLNFVYVDASRNFDRQFGTSRWSMFGQALRRLHDDLNATSNPATLSSLRSALEEVHRLLKTELYEKFEAELSDAFASQLRTSRYDVKFEFRTIDDTNLYKSLYPSLVEAGRSKLPTEVGSGVRNLLVLALFHAFARSFKAEAILGIEEPELYLHPHAQRSLAQRLESLAADGTQIFLSTHSADFLDITRTDRIVLVEQCEDGEEDVCTHVRTSSSDILLTLRQALHPTREMSVESIRSFLRNIKTAEMQEAFFSRMAIIVEGPSEKEALPIFAAFMNFDLNEAGISVICARGKTAIDTLAHVFEAHKIPIYIIFDNDEHGNERDRRYNGVLCKLLNIPPTNNPTPVVDMSYAILKGNWEIQCRHDLEPTNPGLYDRIIAQARTALFLEPDKNKPLVARFLAIALTRQGIVPGSIRQIMDRIQKRLAI